MFSLTGLDGSTIYATVDSIIRIRASIPEDGPPATEVEYGTGYLFTHESIPALLARIGTADHFIVLTTRNGSAVYLNAAAISSIRVAPPINAPGTEIVVGGLYQHVMETPEQVQALIHGRAKSRTPSAYIFLTNENKCGTSESRLWSRL